MSHDEPAPIPEREQTDVSLRVERERVDRVLEEELALIDEAADAFINGARERADRVLAAARTKLDDVSSEGPATASTTRAADLSTERETTDQDLLRERARADGAIATRDEFLGIVSHDLRNMLGVMIGSARLVAESIVAGGDDENLRHTQRILRAGARMNRLMGDLLDIASIEAGMLAVTRLASDPALVAGEAIETFQAQADAAGVALTLVATPPLPSVEFDAARILQVLVNLLSNALKFTARGGRVTLRVEVVSGSLQFSIEDTGSGIAPEKLALIFDRFAQVTPNDRRGVGLGLYISKCIVEGHGGRIWAESEPKVGSTVSFTLPLDHAA
jgi:signal transduction histidine kinase